jgi:chromosome segregation ATPase
MTQEITRWVTEIRTLQQQLAAARQERDQAYKSASSWRRLYDAEAKQRREDAKVSKEATAALQAELSTLKAELKDDVVSTIEARLEDTDLNSVEGLRAELINALQSCDRLQKAIKAEKAAHAETRKTLTTALGETIDALSPKTALVRQKGEIERLESPPKDVDE